MFYLSTVHPVFPKSCPIGSQRTKYYCNIPICNYEKGQLKFAGLFTFQMPNRLSANSNDDPELQAEGGYIEWIKEVNGRSNLNQW